MTTPLFYPQVMEGDLTRALVGRRSTGTAPDFINHCALAVVLSVRDAGGNLNDIPTLNSSGVSPTGVQLGFLASSPGEWSIEHRPAVSTQATVTRTNFDGNRRICRSITASLIAVAVQPSIALLLRDGASGTGPVIWSALLAAAAGQSERVHMSGLSIVGTFGAAMTLEFEGAPAAGNFLQVALSGYTVT